VNPNHPATLISANFWQLGAGVSDLHQKSARNITVQVGGEI